MSTPEYEYTKNIDEGFCRTLHNYIVWYQCDGQCRHKSGNFVHCGAEYITIEKKNYLFPSTSAPRTPSLHIRRGMPSLRTQ